MASRCPIDVPADPASLEGPELLPPLGLIPWGPGHIRALRHSHRWQFSPVNASTDGWAGAIQASQFGNCSRLLLVEDDLMRAGLGFTAKIWVAALLIAVRDNRVLMESRMVASNSTVNKSYVLFERPRWCDRAPYTLQCLYQPWSHCKPPPADAVIVRPGGRPLKVKNWPHNEPYVVTGLGRIHRQGLFWHGARSSAQREAGRFLFRPRPWVKNIADCVMREAGLKPQSFLSIHIRHSVEKEVEGQRLGVSLPGLDAYSILGPALAADSGTRKLFVQTASPVGLASFASVCREHDLELSYTNNTRSENDAWGGWKGGVEMEQAAVAAINAHIGSQALISISPVLSLWTNFLWFSYGHDSHVARTNLCCPQDACSKNKMKGGSKSFEAATTGDQLRANKLHTTRLLCREHVPKDSGID